MIFYFVGFLFDRT